METKLWAEGPSGFIDKTGRIVVLDDGAHDIAAQASAAWEAAVCWDDEYAVKRLARRSSSNLSSGSQSGHHT